MFSITNSSFKKFIKEDLEKIFTLDVYIKDDNTFSLTHTEISDIKLKSPLSPEKYVSEEDLIKILCNEVPQHPRIIAIIGDTGVGKSELCRKIEFELKSIHGSTFFVEHKPRRELVLGPLAFDEHVVKMIRDMNLKKLKVLMKDALDFILSEKKKIKMPKDKIASIVDRFFNNVLNFIEKLESDITVEEVEFKVLFEDDLIAYVVDSEQRKKLVEEVNNLLVKWLGVVTTSLKDVIEKKAKAYNSKGKRYVLILDDIVMLGPAFNDIINVFSDVSIRLGVDIIFGITRGRYIEIASIIDTLKDRAYEIHLTSEEKDFRNASWMLEKEKFKSFVKKYLFALNWGYKEYIRKELEKVEFTDWKIYPFTESFLNNLYNYLLLIAKNKSVVFGPRRVIWILRRILERFYAEENKLNPAEILWEEELIPTGISTPEQIWLSKSEVPKLVTRFLRTMRLYGEIEYKDKNENKIRMNEKIAKYFFNVEDVKELIEKIKDHVNVSIEHNQIVISREKELKIFRREKKKERKEEEITLDAIKAAANKWIEEWKINKNAKYDYYDYLIKGFENILRGIKFPVKNLSIFLGKCNPKNDEISLVPKIIKSLNHNFIHVDVNDILNLTLFGQKNEIDYAIKFLSSHPEVSWIVRNVLNSRYQKIYGNLDKWVLSTVLLLISIKKMKLPENSKEALEYVKEAIVISRTNKTKDLATLKLNKMQELISTMFLVRKSVINYPYIEKLISEIHGNLYEVFRNKPSKIRDGKVEKIVDEVYNFVLSQLQLGSADEIKEYAEKYETLKELFKEYDEVIRLIKEIKTINSLFDLKYPSKEEVREVSERIKKELKLINLSNHLIKTFAYLRIKKIWDDTKYRTTFDFINKIEKLKPPKINLDLIEKMKLKEEELKNLYNEVEKLWDQLKKN